VDFDEFSLFFLRIGVLLKFLSRHFQKLANRHNPMFYRLAQMYWQNPISYIKLVHRHPSTWLIDKPGLHPLFLQLKAKWRPSNETWFMISPIGRNQPCLIMGKVTANFLDLHKKILSNKTSWGVGITKMDKVFLPSKIWYGGN
jgi:hypothetical protein